MLGLGLVAVAFAAIPALLLATLRKERPGVDAAVADGTTATGEHEAAP